MPTIAGTGGTGAMILPLLLQPIDTMAARKQARYERLQLVSALAQEQDRKLAVMKANQTAQQNDLQALASLDVLPTGKSRIQQLVAQPIKNDIADRIKNVYGGDYEQFLNAEGDYHSQRIREAIATNPVVQRELQNKLNVGLSLKDQMDGKILRPGTQQSLIDYNNGIGNVNYTGAIEPIKDLQKHFGETFHPSGRLNQGLIDPKTGYQTAPAVMRQDVINYAKQTGLSDADAEFYVNDHLGYQDGQFSYKIDQEPLGWMQKLKNEDRRIGISEKAQANTAAQQRLSNYYRARADSRAEKQLKLSQDRAANGGSGGANPAAFGGYEFRARVYETKGTPVTPNSPVLSVPILQTGEQTALSELAGLAPIKQEQGVAPKYELNPGPQTQVYTYVAGGKIQRITKYGSLAGKTGKVEFDAANLNNILQIPDPKSRGGYARFVKVNKSGRDYLVKLPDSAEALRQAETNPNAAKQKLPKVNQTDPGYRNPYVDNLDPNSYFPD